MGAVLTPLVAIAALVVNIWASQRVRRKREFEILLEEIRREARERQERIDREAAKREALFDKDAAKREEAIQVLIDRSDRKFEALLARSDELARQSAGVVERVVRNGIRLESLRSARHRTAADPSAPATGKTEAVVAQGVPDEPRPE